MVTKIICWCHKAIYRRTAEHVTANLHRGSRPQMRAATLTLCTSLGGRGRPETPSTSARVCNSCGIPVLCCILTPQTAERERDFFQ